MLSILHGQLKIGQSPDFVMRLGTLDIFHKANIYLFSRDGRFRESAPVSDRSLQTVAVTTRDFLKNPLARIVKFNHQLEISRRRVLETPAGFILIRIRLPVTIDKEKFNEICRDFWRVIFPPTNNIAVK